MRKILFVLIGMLVSSICFAQSTFVIYDNTVSDQLTTFQVANGEIIGDEILMDASTRPPYNVNYFSFTYWGQNFGGNEQMKVLFYKNDGTDGKPNSVLWDSDWFGIPGTTKSQVIFDTGLNVPVEQQNLTWAVTLNGIDTGERAGLWVYSPPTIGNNYKDYWYNDGTGWQLRAGAQPIDFEAKLGVSDELPKINLTTPVNGSHVVAGSTIVLMADATDADGWIQRVEFYVGNTKIGEDTTGPNYSMTWNAGAFTNYEMYPADVPISAKAYDNLNQCTSTAVSTIRIYAPNKPVIVNNPIDLTIGEGETAVFSVVAEALGGASYQWFFNNNQIPGATNSTLTINNADASNAGDYYVVVKDSYGNFDTSSIAKLIVINASQLHINVAKIGLETSGFKIKVNSQADKIYILQASEDLISWNILNYVNGTGSVIELVDDQATTMDKRFYRIVVINR